MANSQNADFPLELANRQIAEDPYQPAKGEYRRGKGRSCGQDARFSASIARNAVQDGRSKKLARRTDAG